MAAPADRSRVRLSARQALQEQENLSRALAACGDRELGALLAHIGRRQAQHSRRLMAWLQPVTQEAAPPPEPAVRAPAKTQPKPPQGNTVSEAAPSRPACADGGLVVTELHRPTPALLQFKLPRPQDFQFEAGQSVKLELDGVRRSYSIVSAPHEPALEFFIELLPGGRMSQRLERLQVGDRIGLGKPKGGLRLDTDYPDHLMVATVTGINPFVSLLRDALHRGLEGYRFHLLQGASYQNEFGYREELERLAAAHPDQIAYQATVSRPDEVANAGWRGSSGRVHTLIDEYIDRAGLDSSSTVLYACGHSGLLEAVKRDLGPRGFSIRTESYD